MVIMGVEKNWIVKPGDLHAALDEFDALLATRSKESDFQSLFAKHPYILSRSLPLRLEPSSIVPLGRPGKSEPDFVAYPSPGGPQSVFGIVEIKRPDSRILTTPRKGVLTLSRDAQTAVSQSVHYEKQLSIVEAEAADSVVMLGSRSHIFIIMGMSDEVAEKLSNELYADQIAGLLPLNCRLLPYDSLFSTFHATVPPSIHLLVPDTAVEPEVIRAKMYTNRGLIEFELFDRDAPRTVANFTKLSRDDFYSDLLFHRVIKDFMIQGGCPEGNGTGGPGYTFEDEFNEHKVVRGVLAMANAGPNTNGSQFFIVTTEAAPWLDGKHTVFGKVVAGMEAVDLIESAEADGRDKPLEPQLIERVEIL